VLLFTVNPLPVPVIAGITPVCAGAGGNVYSTAAGMTNYIWSVSGGGTITSGGANIDNFVTVTWNVVVPSSVSVNYNDVNGCTAAVPTIYKCDRQCSTGHTDSKCNYNSRHVQYQQER